MTKSKLARKKFTQVKLSHHCSSPRQDSNSHRAGTWRQELIQRLWMGDAFWLAPKGLLSLLSYRSQDHQPRDGTTHNGLGPPPLLVINWENALQLDLMEAFLHGSSFSVITLAWVKLTHKNSQYRKQKSNHFFV